MVIEEFAVYCPIAMANIRGMENVLGDRCISLILEKSSKNSNHKINWKLWVWYGFSNNKRGP